MITLDNLIAHHRKSDGKLFLVAKLSHISYLVFDPETGEKETVSGGTKRKYFEVKKDFFVQWKIKTCLKNVKKAVAVRKNSRFRLNAGTGQQEKECTKCFLYKTLDRFSVNDFGKPVSWCKDCIKKYNSKRRMVA